MWDYVDWRGCDARIAKELGLKTREVREMRAKRKAPPPTSGRTKAPVYDEMRWRTAGIGALPDWEVARFLATSVNHVARERKARKMPSPDYWLKEQILPRLEVTRLPPGFRFDLAWLARQTTRSTDNIWRHRAAFLTLVDEVVGPHGVWVRR